MNRLLRSFIRVMTPESISLDKVAAIEWHKRHEINPDHCDRTMVVKWLGVALFRMLHQRNGQAFLIYDKHGEPEISRYWMLRIIKASPNELWFEYSEPS